MRKAVILGAAVAAGIVAATSLAGPALRQENIPVYGVALKVPSSWIGLDPSRVSSAHLAYAVASPTATAGFHSNLNLLVNQVPAGTTIRQWLLGDSAAKYLAIGTLRTVKINGVTGLEYASTRLEASGGRPLYTLEYAFNHRGRAYLFTYSAPASAKADFESLFKASAATIAFAVRRSA